MKIFVGLLLAFCLLSLLSDAKRRPGKKQKTPLPIISVEDILASNGTGKNRILNPDGKWSAPQQIYMKTTKWKWIQTGWRVGTSKCSGTMLTEYIGITAGHCVDGRLSVASVVVYPVQKKCQPFLQGIPACKVVDLFRGNDPQLGMDIAMFRLSNRMRGMGSIQLSFLSPPTGLQLVMTGTGYNTGGICASLYSFQTVVDCSNYGKYGNQWICTNGTYKRPSGACIGDSGGPLWNLVDGVDGLTGITSHGKALPGEPCTADGITRFADLAWFKTWIQYYMRGYLATCP